MHLLCQTLLRNASFRVRREPGSFLRLTPRTRQKNEQPLYLSFRFIILDFPATPCDYLVFRLRGDSAFAFATAIGGSIFVFGFVDTVFRLRDSSFIQIQILRPVGAMA